MLLAIRVTKGPPATSLLGLRFEEPGVAQQDSIL